MHNAQSSRIFFACSPAHQNSAQHVSFTILNTLAERHFGGRNFRFKTHAPNKATGVRERWTECRTQLVARTVELLAHHTAWRMAWRMDSANEVSMSVNFLQYLRFNSTYIEQIIQFSSRPVKRACFYLYILATDMFILQSAHRFLMPFRKSMRANNAFCLCFQCVSHNPQEITIPLAPSLDL